MKKNRGKTILKICLFLILANLPFLTMTHHIGITAFLDSFDNPTSYCYLKDMTLSHDSSIQKGTYLLLQKSSHPGFSIHEGDTVLYYKNEGGISCNKIYSIDSRTPLTTYYITSSSASETTPIYQDYIIGKVVGTIDDNIWNALSLKTWELCISNFNIKAVLTEN